VIVLISTSPYGRPQPEYTEWLAAYREHIAVGPDTGIAFNCDALAALMITGRKPLPGFGLALEGNLAGSDSWR
jgi:hypothetical protein